MPTQQPDIKRSVEASFPPSQTYLSSIWKRSSPEQRTTLSEQLKRINFKYVEAFMKKTESRPTMKIEPIPQSSVKKLTTSTAEHKECHTIGMKTISEGKLAVVTLAGGQGTRLGTTQPKGCYCIGNPSKKSLFQIQAERIRKVSQLATNGKTPSTIAWYIMTSTATSKQTVDFFKKNNFFGLSPTDVVFFNQGSFPSVDTKGNVFLENSTSIATSPNGNGGIYSALQEEGILKDMEKRKIKYIQIATVDNVLLKVADPAFLGACIKEQVEIGCKSVKKETPEESVGVFCLKDGKLSVAEYSEIDNEQATRKDKQSEKLLFNHANIVSHIFTSEFLQQVCSKSSEVLYPHVAHKKITYYDSEKNHVINPTEPNGFKMEYFLFDVFGLAKKFCIVETERSEEFAPLKNAPGASKDSPEEAKKKLKTLHLKYLKNAGAIFPDNFDEKTVECEISPLTSYEGEGMEKYKGKRIEFPFII